MSTGSGLMTAQKARRPHLAKVTGEVGDLRRDLEEELSSLVAMVAEEWANLAAADANAIKASFASSASAEDFSGSDLDGVVGTGEMDPPRNLTITTTSHADIDAVDVVITGTDVDNATLTDTITLTDAGNTTDVGTSAFKTVTRVQIPAQGGIGGALEIGFGDAIGLAKPLKTRMGLSEMTREILNGVALESLVHKEFVDVATADVDAIKTSIASSAGIETYNGADLNGVVGEGVMSPPRNMTITTTVHANIDAVAVVYTGTDIYGHVITDIVTLTDGGGATDVGNVAFATVTEIVVPAQGGTAGALEFGFGSIIGFTTPVKFRNADPQVFAENEAGTPKAYDVLAGTYTAPASDDLNGTVDPGAAPNGTNDYTYSYEPVRGIVASAAAALPYGTYTPPVASGGAVDAAVHYEWNAAA